MGAGLSALRCADILLQHGFKVTILEGRDRIGGRIHQSTLPTGQAVDLGANWIHGTETNPIFEIAKATGTTLHDWGDKGGHFDEHGKVMEDGAELMADVWGLITKAFAYSRDNSAAIDPNLSLFDFIRDGLDSLYEQSLDSARKRRQALMFSEFWGDYVGTKVQNQSLKFLWLEECIDGGMCASRSPRVIPAN